MSLLLAFGVGATIWTALQFILPRNTLDTDELIMKVWENTGTRTKEGLYPSKNGGAWFLPAGLCPVDIEKTLPAIAYQLNKSVEMEVKGKAVVLNFNDPLPGSVPYQDIDLSTHCLGLVIGQTNKGRTILDLNDSHAYVLVGGMPGTGKSHFINRALIILREIIHRVRFAFG